MVKTFEGLLTAFNANQTAFRLPSVAQYDGKKP